MSYNQLIFGNMVIAEVHDSALNIDLHDRMDNVIQKLLNKIKELEDRIKQLESIAADDMMLKK
jgi:hypothetical protein